MTGNGVVLSEIRQTEPVTSPGCSPMPVGYLFHAGLISDAGRGLSFSTIEQQPGLQLLDGLEQATEDWNMYRLKSLLRTPEFGKPEGRTADPSTPLHSGRDDNFVWER